MQKNIPLDTWSTHNCWSNFHACYIIQFRDYSFVLVILFQKMLAKPIQIVVSSLADNVQCYTWCQCGVCFTGVRRLWRFLAEWQNNRQDINLRIQMLDLENHIVTECRYIKSFFFLISNKFHICITKLILMRFRKNNDLS